MALRPCADCNKEISEKAPSCPHCGAPQAAVPSTTAKRQSESSKSSSAFVSGVILVLGVVIILVILRGAYPLMQEAGVAPAPRWVVEGVNGTDNCTVLGDYCLRVTCMVRNVGDAVGVVTVVAELLPETGSATNRQTTVRLEPAQERLLEFDFREAEIEKKYRFGCLIRR